MLITIIIPILQSGFRTCAELKERISDITTPSSDRTYYRVLGYEKKLFEHNDPNALRRRPNIALLELQIRKAKEALASLKVEPDLNPSKFKFSPTWYQELTDYLMKHQDTVGFGPVMVQSCAHHIGSKNTLGTLDLFRH
jgi:hypothetical protein